MTSQGHIHRQSVDGALDIQQPQTKLEISVPQNYRAPNNHDVIVYTIIHGTLTALTNKLTSIHF